MKVHRMNIRIETPSGFTPKKEEIEKAIQKSIQVEESRVTITTIIEPTYTIGELEEAGKIAKVY